MYVAAVTGNILEAFVIQNLSCFNYMDKEIDVRNMGVRDTAFYAWSLECCVEKLP